MIFYERKLQDDSTESKNIEFDFDFAEKFKIEVSSSVDFFLVDHPNLDLKHSVDVEMSLEAIGIKRFKRFRV